MTTDQLVQELQTVHNALKNLEGGQAVEFAAEQSAEESKTPALTIKQAFRKDEVICMVCGKGGFKTLKKHLATAHQLTPGQYRKQFGIKSSQKLAATTPAVAGCEPEHLGRVRTHHSISFNTASRVRLSRPSKEPFAHGGFRKRLGWPEFR